MRDRNWRVPMAISLAVVLLAVILLLVSYGKQDEIHDTSGKASQSSSSVSQSAGGGREKQLYASVTAVQGNNGASASLITKPEGYPAEIGDALSMMMSLHEKTAAYLYHVAFSRGDAGSGSTRETIGQLLKNADALYVNEWVEIAASYPQETSEAQQDVQGWYYYLFTAEEIRTLANAGIQCRLVGSGESLSGKDETGKLSWEQAMEHICQWSGDSFRAKPGETSDGSEGS